MDLNQTLTGHEMTAIGKRRYLLLVWEATQAKEEDHFTITIQLYLQDAGSRRGGRDKGFKKGTIICNGIVAEFEGDGLALIEPNGTKLLKSVTQRHYNKPDSLYFLSVIGTFGTLASRPLARRKNHTVSVAKYLDFSTSATT